MIQNTKILTNKEVLKDCNVLSKQQLKNVIVCAVYEVSYDNNKC